MFIYLNIFGNLKLVINILDMILTLIIQLFI